MDTVPAEPADVGGDEVVLAAEAAKARGNDLYAARSFAAAAREYTAAARLYDSSAAPQSRHALAEVLSNRAAALVAQATALKARPAVVSERGGALFGEDPIRLAAMALKDARRAGALRPTWHKPSGRAAAALFVLERYEEAEAAYEEGLLLAPDNAALLAGLEEVRRVAQGPTASPPPPPHLGTSGSGGGGSGGGEGEGAAAGSPAASEHPVSKRPRRTLTSLDDTECILCARLLYEPVTTPCGHSFCGPCLTRALDHTAACPMCRAVLHVSRGSLPVTLTLRALLSRSFPEAYAARAAEEAAGAGSAGVGPAGLSLPLFVMQLLLPGERMSLNIFEPRYRLMVRRCMEGSRRMATAQGAAPGAPSVGGLDPVACECDILECEPQPDGRYSVALAGRRLFRMERMEEVDGYRVASGPLVIASTPSPGDAAAWATLALTAHKVDTEATNRLQALRHLLRSRPEELVELLATLGTKPTLKPSTAAGEGVAGAATGAATGAAAPGSTEPEGTPGGAASSPGTPSSGGAPLPGPAGVDVPGVEALSWYATRLLCLTSGSRARGLRSAAVAAPSLQARMALLADAFKPPSG